MPEQVSERNFQLYSRRIDQCLPALIIPAAAAFGGSHSAAAASANSLPCPALPCIYAVEGTLERYGHVVVVCVWFEFFFHLPIPAPSPPRRIYLTRSTRVQVHTYTRATRTCVPARPSLLAASRCIALRRFCAASLDKLGTRRSRKGRRDERVCVVICHSPSCS